MAARKGSLAKEIKSISRAFNDLARAFSRLAPALASAGAPMVKRPRKKPIITPARRAALKLQGQYMGTLRGLKPADKAKIKKIRVQKGLRAALAAARRIAS